MMRALLPPLLLVATACPSSVESQPAPAKPKPSANDPVAADPDEDAAQDSEEVPADEPETPTSPSAPTVAEREAAAEEVIEHRVDPDPSAVAKVSDDVVLPLRKLLGKKPAQVEALLGEPLAKGQTRESCVRFTPNRTWFECKWVWQRYADKTNTFKAVQVTYEDGQSAAVAFEGVPGEGTFDVDKALAAVGLVLPGTPNNLEPEPFTKLWTWFNDQSRLVIGKNQYRVLLSVREGKWEHSKVDIVLNSDLTPEQRAKIKPTKGKAQPAEEG